jgi:hypothetical protein
MKMVRHQTEAVHLPACFFTALLQGRQKPAAVLVVVKDVFAVITSIHHVVHGAGVLDA